MLLRPECGARCGFKKPGASVGAWEAVIYTDLIAVVAVTPAGAGRGARAEAPGYGGGGE